MWRLKVLDLRFLNGKKQILQEPKPSPGTLSNPTPL